MLEFNISKNLSYTKKKTTPMNPLKHLSRAILLSLIGLLLALFAAGGCTTTTQKEGGVEVEKKRDFNPFN
ncbi:MAG: hypothetical protein ACLFUF_05160 [Opitutales bacterium]